MASHSILFDRPELAAAVATRDEPSSFADLNLDQVLAAMTRGREDYDLDPFFYTPLHDVRAVSYRHDVLRDLEQPPLVAAVGAFAQQMRIMRDHLVQAEKRRYAVQKERWFLDAVAIYCDAVRKFATTLAALDVQSEGFQAFRAYLASYSASAAFTSLAAETARQYEALDSVTYSVQINGGRVTVSPYDGEPDYGAEVEATFAKFKQGTVKDYRGKLPDFPDLNSVEARVLELVTRLYPAVFQALHAYSDAHQDFLDDTIRAFDREVQFYVAYLEYMKRFTAAGLPFCYPEVSTRSKEVSATDAYDLALATKLVADGAPVVGNDFVLHDPEHIIVITGPNQGGKTTFARMFGELHYLASLGLPVPAREARLFLPDQIFTHFEKEEDLATLRGKLEDEIVRIHGILAQATRNSLLIMNESFSATTLQDSLVLGTAILRQIIALDLLCVYVTFVDELASLGETTVSMVSTVVPDNPAVRTFKLVRRPADGRAYATAIAQQYGLTYEALRRRVA